MIVDDEAFNIDILYNMLNIVGIRQDKKQQVREQFQMASYDSRKFQIETEESVQEAQ